MVSMAGAGDTLAIRMAGGILNAVELPELVTNSLDEYEALILALGRNPARVAGMRQHLETHRARLPLFDTPRQVAYLEACFEQMVDNAAKDIATSFTVPALLT